MSEPWGPHDLGGQDGGPIDLAEHDTAHWEWQIDAMVRLALKKGLISDFAELRDGIEQLTDGALATIVAFSSSVRLIGRKTATSVLGLRA